MRRLEGTAPGPPTRVSNTDGAAFGRLMQDPGGGLRAAWGDGLAHLLTRRSRDGRRWTDAERLATASDPSAPIGDPGAGRDR